MSEKPDPASFAPIISGRTVGSWELFFRKPEVRARRAHVFVTAHGGTLVSTMDKQLHSGELVGKRVRTVYEVDTGRHETTIDELVPSSSVPYDFRAIVDLHWQVVDPVKVVLDGVTDVRRTLRPAVLELLRNVTRNHAIDRPEKAERIASEGLRASQLGGKYGLKVTTFLRLGMDNPSRQQAQLTAKVDSFRAIIAAGDLDRFALQLAQNPAAAQEVVTALMTERGDYRRDTFKFLTRLIESDALERWQVHDQVREALKSLQDAIHMVIPGTEEAQPDVLGGMLNGARPE